MSNHSEYHPIINLQARAWHAGVPTYFELKGQVARTLAALITAKSNGITALEMSTWAYRLGAYIHNLRRDHNLDIATLREEHPGGWHARYVLNTPVEIQELTTE